MTSDAITLFDQALIKRPFKSHVLDIGKLNQWAHAKGLSLATDQPLDGHQFVQVEWLLCSVERAAIRGIGHGMAQAYVEVDMPELMDLDDDGETAKELRLWQLGAQAHYAWRTLIETAVADGELALLHFGSKLPIDPSKLHVKRATTEREDNRKPATLRLQAEVLRLMTKNWNERPSGTSPKKQDLCEKVHTEMESRLLKGANGNVVNPGMVWQMARPWKRPDAPAHRDMRQSETTPAPVVTANAAHKKRHPFKGTL